MRPPLTRDQAIASLSRRLAKRSRVLDNGCVEWTGYVNPNGYGQITLPAVLHGEPGLGRIATAPRVTCWLAHGARPSPDSCVCHACDNRTCINPEHLRWGDPWSNAQDAKERGRHQRGERHPDAHLTDGQVREVLARARAGERVYALAEEYGVDWSSIYAWLRGEGRARHLSPTQEACQKLYAEGK